MYENILQHYIETFICASKSAIRWLLTYCKLQRKKQFLSPFLVQNKCNAIILYSTAQKNVDSTVEHIKNHLKKEGSLFYFPY